VVEDGMMVKMELVERERLGRLHAEWELAQLRARIARDAFEAELKTVCENHGIEGKIGLDLASGTLTWEEEENGSHLRDG